MCYEVTGILFPIHFSHVCYWLLATTLKGSIMNTRADKTQKNTVQAGRQKNQSVANEASRKQSGVESTFQFVDNRPKAKAQRKIQEIADIYSDQQHSPIQNKENRTGLPHKLKSGIENISGQSMDDVRVHYNSGEPSQLRAHAYARGTDIHLGTGQEKYLPHEAWHVVQQKQGRVKPTAQMKGKLHVNDDKGLEKPLKMCLSCSWLEYIYSVGSQP